MAITWLIPPNVSLIITFAKSENLCDCAIVKAGKCYKDVSC